MTLDGLQSLATNQAFVDGVIITLPEAPSVEFRVILPGPHNRAYLAAMSRVMDEERNEIDSYLAAEELFVKHCLVSINGEKPPADFNVTYTPALKRLMAEANRQAEVIRAEVEDAEKKSAITLIGKSAGAES